jgi:uncharacterized protein (TIGR02588 family)
LTAKRTSGGSGILRTRTPFEWTILLVSLAATVAVVVGLVVSGLAGPRGPADLHVTVADVGGSTSGGRPLDVTVTNAGGTSAVTVVVEVSVGDIVREVTLDLVAKGDRETATVVFPLEATGPPVADVVSYTDP